MKHPLTDTIIANTVITPLIRVLNTFPNVTTLQGWIREVGLKNGGELSPVASTVA